MYLLYIVLVLLIIVCVLLNFVIDVFKIVGLVKILVCLDMVLNFKLFVLIVIKYGEMGCGILNK